jgi:FkbM family methyltransferase
LIKKGDIIIDIGANLGYYSILFAKWTGPTGKVYAVEPVTVYNKIYNEIAKKYSNITLYPYALGSEEKTINMVSSPGKGYLSTGLLHVHDAQKDRNIENEEFRFRAHMKIPSRLFGAIEKIDYIKCDIEGYEYQVFSDMRAIIQRHHPKVQVEIWGENKEKLNNLFTDMGYTLYKLVNNKLVAELNSTDKKGGEFIFIHKDDQTSPTLPAQSYL